jgi:hypothetical protein
MKQCFFFVIFALISCNKAKNANTNSIVPDNKPVFLTVDVTKQYSKSDTICLQKIADVEYIQLETTNDFLCAGVVAYIDDSLIIYRNGKAGEILIFNRNGKALRKISREGQSGEEYASLNKIVYDNATGELYVNDMMKKQIIVYDLNGKFKRSFSHCKGAQYSHIYLFDNQYLLVYNGSPDGFNAEKYPFKLISRQTGKVIKEIPVPFSKRISTKFTYGDEYYSMTFSGDPSPEPAVRMGNDYILNEISSDTIYKLSADLKLTPMMAQTPSVQNMGENPQYISFVKDSYDYQFLFIQKKEFNKETRIGFPTTAVMIVKKSGKIFEQNFYDADRPDKVFEFYLNNSNQMAKSNQYFDEWSAHSLKKVLEKGQLKGRLKEIAEKIDEDDNPMLMIVTFKEKK